MTEFSMDQQTRRTELYRLLGDLPERDRPIGAETVAVEEREAYTLETLLLDLNGVEAVPAFFTRPRVEGPVPVVLYNHAHGSEYGIGKRELIDGRPGILSPPYAEVFARQGWAALCLDTWAFGERGGRTESAIFKQMLWEGRVMWGMMVYDSLRAVDYLHTRPEVDATRLATLGLSMGSTMAWWTAALDPRVTVTVDFCCLTDYQALIETRGLDGHGIYYYVPRLLKHFTSGEINGLIAPRPHLALAGNYDALTPRAGLDRLDREIAAAYQAAGAPEAWKLIRYDCGHMETVAMRAEAVKFLRAWL